MFDVEKILQFVYKYSLVIYTSLVFLIILLRSIPGSKRARITRYFRRNSDIRFQLIKNLDKQPDVVLGDFSSLEIVTALTIMALPFLTGNWVKSDQNVQAKGSEIAIPITASIEHLDFQIDSFGKAIGIASNKIIENLLPPIA